MKMPGLRDRALKALKAFVQKPGISMEDYYFLSKLTGDLSIIGTSYSKDGDALYDLLKVLTFDGYLRESEKQFCVSVPGVLAVEALSRADYTTQQGFVAMDFSEPMHTAWTNGFDPAIRKAGYKPMRIDNKEFVGGITDEIIAEIRQSRFLVADYSGHRPGVYFEAGFALGLGITVIPTCREDEVSALHFDVKHLNTLLWQQPSDLIEKLSVRIRAVIGSGPDYVIDSFR